MIKEGIGEYLIMYWNIERTIKNLVAVKEIMQTKIICEHPDTEGDTSYEEIEFDFNCAITALKKQIPMKIKEVHVDEYFCPACGSENNCNDKIVAHKFCNECGQAFDLSEE